MGIGVSIACASGFGADSVALLWEGMSQYFHISVGNARQCIRILTLKQKP